jgi:hypothetical protein
MQIKDKLLLRVLIISMTLLPIPALCWDSVVSGKIGQLEGVGSAGGAPGNYDLRIYLAGKSDICVGATDPKWAFINSNEANYQGMLSLILMAQTTGRNVTLYTVKAQNGYCQLGHIAIAPAS